MLALGSVWLALITFLVAAAMLVYRPAFTDPAVTFVLWFGAPGAMCLAGLVLWAYRKEADSEPGVAGQRLQARVAIGLAVLAAAIVYGLIIASKKIERIDEAERAFYNRPSERVPAPFGGKTPMQVTINGKPQEVEDDLSVADLLAVRNLEPVRVAVEINEELVPRRRFAETPVRPGDRIEIVTLVGGG